MVWYGMVCEVCYGIWYGMVWCGMVYEVWYGMIWYGVVWYVWYVMVWYDMVWCCMVWYVRYSKNLHKRTGVSGVQADSVLIHRVFSAKSA